MAKKILFVCKFNRFRSKTAEAYFNKVNQNKNWKAVSGGLIRMQGLLGPTMLSRANFIKKRFGFKIGRRSNGLNDKLLRKVDKIVVVAADVPKIVFNFPDWKDKVECWKIPDEWKDDNKSVEGIVKDLIKRVDLLIGRLDNE